MKKPAPLGLLANPDEIAAYSQKYMEYKKFIIEYIHHESGLSDPSDMVIFLAENYHQDSKIRIKQKVGAKTKWGEYINCVVAVEIDFLRTKHKTRILALENLSVMHPWNKLLPKNSKDPIGVFNKADKAGRKSKLYKVVANARLFSGMTNDLKGYYESVESAINEVAKGIKFKNK